MSHLHSKVNGQPTPTYVTWRAMIARCEDSKHENFRRYGERGIRVCAAWRSSFKAFLADMGERPEGTTIDRKNVNGDYEPGNCKWSTAREQSGHRRNTRYVTAFGKTMHVMDWARETGLPFRTIYWRLDHGWPVDQALSLVPNKTQRVAHV